MNCVIDMPLQGERIAPPDFRNVVDGTPEQEQHGLERDLGKV